MYCPFKAFEDYYRNADPRYMNPAELKAYFAGWVIADTGASECIACIQEINNRIDTDSAQPNRESIFF